ncbi:hypothetical protein D3C86_2080400 [compost metagenome]
MPGQDAQTGRGLPGVHPDLREILDFAASEPRPVLVSERIQVAFFEQEADLNS